jgi:hypothetical protein
MMTDNYDDHYQDSYEPGDLFTYDGAEFVAHTSRQSAGCRHCIGNQHDNVCAVLPPGCGHDDIVWKPNNIEAKVLAVTLRLEA